MPSWLHVRTPPRPSEDPAVSAVEQILNAAPCLEDSLPTAAGEALAKHALWICACMAEEEAPTWLICDTDAGGLVWGRVSDGIEPLDLVKASHTAGGHTHPAEVLRWLRGEVSDPWGAGSYGNEDTGVGYGDEQADVLEALRRRIHGE